MNTCPPLTLALLQELSDRALQSDYLNHLDRTAEVASLLSQVQDQALALRIINLALDVDLMLGSRLASSVSSEVQEMIVERIDRLEIPIPFKVVLWHKTKAKSALPYLQNLFIFRHRYWNIGHDLAESVISAIMDIDRDLAIVLLCEAVYDVRFYSSALERLTELAPVEAIEPLAYILRTSCFATYGNAASLAIEALGQIGTDEAISVIKDALEYRCRWSQREYIQGLGMVAEPEMVGHLVYLLSQPEDTEDFALEAVYALERVGIKMFEYLHRAIYWISFDEYRHTVFDKILEILFKWDYERTMTSLSGAMQSYDPVVRRRAAMALSAADISITNQNSLSLFDALDFPDTEQTDDESALSTLLKLINDPEIENREEAVHRIVELGSEIVFPTLLMLVEQDELVVPLINALDTLAKRNPEAKIFEGFRCDRAVAMKFLITAERAIVEKIQSKSLCVNSVIVELSAIGDKLAIDVLRQVLIDDNSCDAVDGAILILGRIGTTQAVLALLSILPAYNIATNWLSIQLCDLGGLSIIPQLQSTQRQIYCPHIARAVSQIQEREGLYNSEFSDNPSYPLFQPKFPRLRDILLGNRFAEGDVTTTR
jgi:HEAT repeat protein